MSYTVTVDNLPNFLAQISYLMRVDGKVVCDIQNPISDDSFLVDQRRLQEPNSRDTVRQEMDKYPDRFSSLVTD